MSRHTNDPSFVVTSNTWLSVHKWPLLGEVIRLSSRRVYQGGVICVSCHGTQRHTNNTWLLLDSQLTSPWWVGEVIWLKKSRLCKYHCVPWHDTGWRRPIGCLMFKRHFPQKTSIICGSFAKMWPGTWGIRGYGSLPLCAQMTSPWKSLLTRMLH